VILHVRRSADKLLKHLRDLAPEGGWHGIGHAFNGSEQQAAEFLKLGFKLGFGGAVTFEPALQLRRLAAELPLDSLVMETDSPDIPPHWIYKTAAEREAGKPQGRNEPGELPRIAQQVAELRGISVEALAAATTANARHALPKLKVLLLVKADARLTGLPPLVSAARGCSYWAAFRAWPRWRRSSITAIRKITSGKFCKPFGPLAQPTSGPAAIKFVANGCCRKAWACGTCTPPASAKAAWTAISAMRW
jgi:hypothetical protein